jgi:F-type H+-transporting ATPase subunit delta
MNESLLSGRYAKALLAQAIEEGQDEVLYPILRHLSQTLRSHLGAKGVVDNPTLSEELRAEFVVALAGEEAPLLLKRFVGLVFEHGREALLGEISRAYVGLYRRHRGITYARITTARRVDDTARQQLQDLLAREFGGEVEMDEILDEQLLGGFVIRVDGKQMDASVKGQLERIRNQFLSRNKSIV